MNEKRTEYKIIQDEMSACESHYDLINLFGFINNYRWMEE